MLDISKRSGQNLHVGDLCDYCSDPATHKTEYGLMCHRHLGLLRMARKAGL